MTPRPSRLFRLLLRLYPSRTRRLDRTDMWLAFNDRLEDARTRSRRDVARVWAAEIGQAIRVAAWERPRLALQAATPDLLFQDLHTGVRAIAATRTASLAAIVTLGLGIGANLAVFTLVYSVLWRPPASVTEPERLVTVSGDYHGQPMLLSYPRYVAYRDLEAPFSALLAFEDTVAHLDHGEATARLRTTLASGNYFTGLGIAPAAGRVLVPEDDREGAEPVAVISHRVWMNVFGGDRDVAGRGATISGQRVRIVGVAPARFHGVVAGASSDLWLPLSMRGVLKPHDPSWRTNAFAGWLRVIGRLPHGTDIEVAAAQLNSFELDSGSAHPLIDAAMLTDTVWVPIYQREDLRSLAVLLLGAVGLVIGIACANLAGLMLVRGALRVRELRVRAALGATGTRLIRQLTTEGILLALAGGAVGLALAQTAIATVGGTGVVAGVRLDGLDLSLDPTIGLFGLVLVLAAGLAFSLLPALAAARSGVGLSFRRQAARNPGRRARSLLTVGQLSASVVLLVVSAALLASIARTQSIDPGFDPEGVLRASVDLDLDALDDVPGRRGGIIQGVVGWGRVIDRIDASAAADRVPLGPAHRGTGTEMVYAADGGEPVAPANVVSPDGGLLVAVTSVTERYHWTLQIPILEGRVFYDRDRADTEPVAIVSQALAEALWPGERAVDRTLQMGRKERTSVRVVGVADNLRRLRNDGAPIMEVYRPMAQRPARAATFFWRASDHGAAAETLLAVAREHSPDATIYDVGPLSSLLEEAVATERLIARAIGSFAAIALCLAAVGLYGVLAQTAIRRRREFGIRLALGAREEALSGAVFRTACAHAAVGIVLGLFGAWLAMTGLASQLPGLTRLPLPYWLAIALILAAVTVLSTLGPARAATRVAPTEALRAE